MDVPSRTDRPCIPETVAGTEHGSSVQTVVEIHQISFVIYISSVDIEACSTLEAFAVIRRITGRIAVGKGRSVELVVRKAIG